MSADGTPTPREHLLFLARAESRVRILEALRESESATQLELRTRLDASRTTVSRALKSLTEQGWVERSDGAYRLTRSGALIAAEFTRLLDEIERIEELDEFLRLFPADVEAPDVLDVADFEVTYATDADPYAPARKQSGILSTADRLRMLLPAIDLESTERIAEQVTERGLVAETVVSPGVEATMESEEFAPVMREKVRTGRSPVFVAQETVPFYLGLADDGRVQIGLADGDGLPRVLLETSDGSVREWAEGVYREFRGTAERKPAAGF